MPILTKSTRLPAFPPLVWVMLAGIFLTRIGFFMVWPFLAVILNRDFHLPPSRIGGILAATAVAGVALSFYTGNLSDRFGRRRIMIAGCFGTMAAYGTLATANTVVAYSVGAFLVGLCRNVIESPGTALIADSIENQKTRELAFHIRYFLFNVGAAIGPLIGLIFGLAAQQATFWITCAVYSVFAGILLASFRLVPEVLPTAAREDTKLRAAVRTVRNDRRFLILLLANFLVMLAYSQLESTVVQYLTLESGGSAVGLVTALIMTNGITIVLFQFPLLRLLGRYALHVRANLGLALFATAFLTYAVLPAGSFPAWIFGTWILSLGEAILFPTISLQVDRLAPDHLKGSYFGATAFGGLGFAAGPLIGGFMLQYWGGAATFTVTALITSLAGLSYWQSSRVSD
jgi:MFS family permease